MTKASSSPADESPDAQLWQLWRQGQRVDFAEFLAGFADLEAAEMVAVLLVDQRERWLLGQRIAAEDYLRRFPDLRGDADTEVGRMQKVRS